ncbi:MAG: peptidoglycan-binding domain-containing protein [Acidimicrobiales bacterium]
MASKGSGIAVLVVFGLIAIAASSDSGCAVRTDNNDDFDLEESAGGLSTCDGVVAVESPSGSAQVPGETALFGSDDADCRMDGSGGHEEAVVALQAALVRCNGQDIALDGEYGSETTQAVTRVQERAGVAADGTFGPNTRRAMRWPTTSAETTCVPGASLGAVVDGAS